ncbi:hypothetical protein J2743_001341 [Methanobacterium petrolearium]|nr:hypothetical protein [Methanobacterium petrolearium]
MNHMPTTILPSLVLPQLEDQGSDTILLTAMMKSDP